MIGLAILALTATQIPSQPSDTVFACQLFRNEREASDGSVHVVDVRVVRRADGTWTIEKANQPVVTATPFEAQFGSVGGSVGLRWQDVRGKKKTAYISFSDMRLPEGKEYFWLNFDRPSLWEPPGYGCESQGLANTGAAA